MTTIKTLKNNLSSIEVSAPKFTSKSDFAQSRVTLDGKALKVKLVGEIFMLPSKNEHEDYGTSFKMGCEFDEGDMIVFETVLDKMLEEVDASFKVKPSHEEGKIFFKLPTNKNMSEFTFDSNVPIKPGKLGHDKLDQHMPFYIELIVGGWYLKKLEMGEERKFGLKFTIKKIHFGEEKKIVKKRKVEEDEVSTSPS